MELNARQMRRRGMVSIWAAIMLLVLIFLVGLALDAGWIYMTGQRLQNAADAAALAGAAHVQFNQTTAVNKAVSTAAKNKAPTPSGAGTINLNSADDVAVGNYTLPDGPFTVNGTPFNAVKVIARRTTGSTDGPQPLFFGPILGSSFNTAEISRQAIAMAGGTLAAGLLVLDPTKQGALSTNGTITINISGNGAIQVNSSHASAAVNISGTAADFNVGDLRINGGLSTSGQPNLPAKTYTNTTPVLDPLAAMPAPAKGSDLGSINQNGNGTVTAPPGYYSGGISQSKGTLILNPGVYVLGPPGLNIEGGTFTANGSMFYLTKGNSGTNYGSFAVNAKKSTATFSPPTSGTYSGMLIFLDRTAPSTYQMALGGGNDVMSLSGTLYLPSAHLDLQGGPSLGTPSQIIANTVHLGGNPAININYDGRNPVTINNVFLVQ